MSKSKVKFWLKIVALPLAIGWAVVCDRVADDYTLPPSPYPVTSAVCPADMIDFKIGPGAQYQSDFVYIPNGDGTVTFAPNCTSPVNH